MPRSERAVQITLQTTTVTERFRSAIFRAARRAGMNPSEFVIAAAGDRLRELGHDFSGVFARLPKERSLQASKRDDRKRRSPATR
jgi:hypothetical protein